MKLLTSIGLMGLLIAAASSSWALQVGDSEQAVKKELGKPMGSIGSGGSKTLFYGRGDVVIKHGKVASYSWMTDTEFKKKQDEKAKLIEARKIANAEAEKKQASILNSKKPTLAKKIFVNCLSLGKNTANCYVVSGDNNDAYVIDPGGNSAAIMNYLKSKNLDVLGYLITHGHGDHIWAVPGVMSGMPATLGIHKLDVPLYEKRKKASAPFDLFFAQNKDYGKGAMTFRVIHTPGHSPGGVCFYFKKAGILFTGDTLFPTSVGRTDLDGGSNAALTASLRKLKVYPANTIIYSGHGPKTTFGAVLKKNPFMKEL